MVRVLLLVVMLALPGCVGMSLKQSVAACYTSVETMANTASGLRQRGQLSDSSRDKVVSIGESALKSCSDADKALVLGNVPETQNKLKAVEEMLIAAEKAMKEK